MAKLKRLVNINCLQIKKGAYFMKRKKHITFEKAFNSLQRKLIAEMLINNDVEKAKNILCSYKVQYTDELAVEIKAKYGKNKECKDYETK